MFTTTKTAEEFNRTFVMAHRLKRLASNDPLVLGVEPLPGNVCAFRMVLRDKTVLKVRISR